MATAISVSIVASGPKGRRTVNGMPTGGSRHPKTGNPAPFQISPASPYMLMNLGQRDKPSPIGEIFPQQNLRIINLGRAGTSNYIRIQFPDEPPGRPPSGYYYMLRPVLKGPYSSFNDLRPTGGEGPDIA